MDVETSEAIAQLAATVALLFAQLHVLAGQAPAYSFDGIGLSSDFKTVAARYSHSTPQDQYVLLAPADIHDHISAIEVSGAGMTRRVRVAFETRPDGRRPDYPACAQVEATLVRQYGQPHTIHRFYEEASRRADRVWQSPAEQLTLLCFEGPRRRLLAEAVQITPR
jgi:hypothetical protein